MDIFQIGYIIMKDSDYVKSKSVNLFHLFIDEVDGYIEKKNGNKQLILHSTDKNEKVLMKYTKLGWN